MDRKATVVGTLNVVPGAFSLLGALALAGGIYASREEALGGRP